MNNASYYFYSQLALVNRTLNNLLLYRQYAYWDMNEYFLNWGWSCLVKWWRHQMETFSALLAFCQGNSPVNDEFPSQRPVTRSFDAFFDLRLNKRLSKQSRRRWLETLSRSLWRRCNELCLLLVLQLVPVNPSGHKQVKSLCVGTQVPPLAHRPVWQNS